MHAWVNGLHGVRGSRIIVSMKLHGFIDNMIRLPQTPCKHLSIQTHPMQETQKKHGTGNL